MTQLESIHAAIPHRGPMLLIDHIVQQEEDRIVCRKTFHEQEFFFQGHYPELPLVPGVILCECAMQAGAILLSKYAQQNSGVPVATRMNDVRFKKMIRPGDTVLLEVEMTERIANAYFLRGKVRCDGKLAVSLAFACTMATIDETT